MFIIGGVQKSTLVDFPGKIAAIVFTQGCNFACGYCHNPELLDMKAKSDFQVELFYDFLKNRQGKLDGVVITGGEPTLQSGLYDFICRVKDLGFAVKLDTNGTNPQIVEKLIKYNLIDYIAMDIKASIEKYPQITGKNIKSENILRSIDLIRNSCIDYEFRTTVVKSQLSMQDFEDIGQMIKGAKRYYLQKFVSSKILDESLINAQTYSDEEFKIICSNLAKYVEFVDFR